MENTEKLELFEKTPVPKAVFALCIPTVIGCLVTVLYNLADTYFVGMLGDPIQNAAVTLAAPVLLAFNAVNNLFGVGSSSMMSRALGRKDFETVFQSSAFGFYSAIFCGVLFGLLCTVFRPSLLSVLGTRAENAGETASYLFWTVTCGSVPAILNVVMGYFVRAEGSALHASIGTMSGCLLNIVLDPVFILPWGLDMGAAGAGCATFLSNCTACLYFFILLTVRRQKTYVRIHPKYFSLKRSIVLGVAAVGIPAAVQNLLNVTGLTVLNNFSAAYSSSAVAAMGISQKINMIPMYIAMGLSQGIMPLIGYSFSSQSYARMKQTLFFTAKITLSFLTAVTVFYYVGSEWLITLFMKNEEIIRYGSRFLRGMCLSTPFLAFDFLGVGVYQACGMGRKSLIFAVMRKIVLEIPALVLLNAWVPLYGLAYAQTVAEVILAIAAAIVLKRLFRQLERRGERAKPQSD